MFKVIINKYDRIAIFYLFIYFFKFYFIFKLYIIVLVLPNSKMTLLFWVRVYTPFLCLLSREYPLAFVGELIWWC